MMTLDLATIKVSECNTHHTHNDRPLYPYRFLRVLKYHSPGLAPAQDDSGAFHIDIDAQPAYQERFIRTFGFYCNYAAVETVEGWGHINFQGKFLYSEKYAWCGNYQENICVVRNHAGNYLHLDIQGKCLYPEEYLYAGDFKDGIAVVCHKNGKSSHIDSKGQLIHDQWYERLDIFHKGFACAKDENGWFHITKDGLPSYNHRFADIEPFYNGQGYAQTLHGDLVVINENGQIIKAISHAKNNFVGSLSSDLVGFWKIKTIQTALQLGIFDLLPSSLENISVKSGIPVNKAQRFLCALAELGLIEQHAEIWILSAKGKLLSPSSKSFMAAATYMWQEVEKEWNHLKEKLCTKIETRYHTFKESTTNEEKLAIYRHALNGYAQEDFYEITQWPIWNQHEMLIAFGHTGIYLLTEILKNSPYLQGTVALESYPFYKLDFKKDIAIKKRIRRVFMQYDQEWTFSGDAILMPRFLHYFPDVEVLEILKKTYKALPKGGKLYIFEMLLNSQNYSGSLLDLNMLVESGGKLRTFEQFQTLLKQVGFFAHSVQSLKPHLQLIQADKQ